MSSRKHDEDDKREHSELAIAVCGLTCALNENLEWFKSHSQFATKHDLKEMENRIMASQAEIVADLKTAIASLKQTNIDIKDLQGSVDVLKAKIVELEALVAAGGTISQELVDAVAEVKSLAQATDDAIPNSVPVPPTV